MERSGYNLLENSLVFPCLWVSMASFATPHEIFQDAVRYYDASRL